MIRLPFNRINEKSHPDKSSTEVPHSPLDIPHEPGNYYGLWPIKTEQQKMAEQAAEIVDQVESEFTPSKDDSIRIHEMLQDKGNHYVASLPSKQTLAYGKNPDEGPSVAGAAVTLATNRLLTLELETERVLNDNHLSEVGKNKRLEAVRAESLRGIGNAFQYVEMAEENAIKAEAALYAVPQVDPTHSADAIQDREIRDWMRSLDVNQRTDILREIINDGHERILLALCRSPIPCGVPEKIAKQTWRDNVERKFPEKAKQVADQKASVEWARIAIGSAAKIAAKTSGLDELGVFKALGGVGLPAFGFTDPLKVKSLARVVESLALKKAS